MFKKLFFKAFVILAIFAGGGAYMAYLKGVDIGTLASRMFQFARLGDMNLETLSIESEGIEDNAEVLRAGRQRVYKWQDQQGQWHYTQIRPPADARTVQTMDVNPQTNVIAGYRKPVTLEKADAPEAPEQAAPEEPIGELPDNPYSPETIKKLFEDAKELQGKLTERYETQQQLLQGNQ